jgi:gliding motility-associated-like protein
MKNLKKLFFLLVIMQWMHPLFAQVLPSPQPNQDPCNPLVLCGGGMTTPGSYQGVPFPNSSNLNPGCMPGFYNVLFWEVTISQSGLFCFTLTPTNACDDYDWTVYKINPSLPCPQNLASAVVVRSDANDIYNSPGGLTGLSTTATFCCCQPAGAGPAFLTPINATTGDVYLIAICNAGTYGCPPGTQPSPVNISFPGSTAVFLDSLDPRFKNIEPSCNLSTRVVINMNKQIQCSSIDPDGSDFSINNGGTIGSAYGIGCPNITGLTSQVVVNFAPPLPPGNYILSAQVGHDGNTLLDACDTALKVPDTLHFSILPSPPLVFVQVDTPACSEIRIPLSLAVACDSIDANGSDFTVSGPQSVNVIAAYGLGCDSSYFTDTVVLMLDKPIQTDGVYTITAKVGNDNNTLMDTCGHRMAPGTHISYTINTFDGRLKAAPDSVICEPGYLSMRTTNYASAPDSAVTCGIGTGTPCNNLTSHYPGVGDDTLSSQHSPFYAYGVSRMQILYTAKELQQAGMKPGTIKALSWHVIQKNTTSAFNNYTIKLGCTSSNSVGGGFLSNVQVVYSAANYVPLAGWNKFNLTTPYKWDGKSNIVVEICDNNAVSTNTADVVDNTMTTFNSVYHLYSFSAPSGCAMYASTVGAAEVKPNNLRPKIRFDICEAPAGAPSSKNYAWTPDIYLSNSKIGNPRIYFDSSKTYLVTTVDNNGCAHRDSVHVTVSYRNPEFLPADTSFCLGFTMPLRASGGLKYVWQATDPGAIFSCNNCSTPIVTPSQSGKFNVIISDQYNCADTLSDTVTVFALPVINAYPKDTTIFYGGNVQLYASGATYYMWTPSFNLDDPSMTAPLAGPIYQPMSYVVIGFDNNNCSNSDTIQVNLNYRSPIWVPSAFTPNQDGKNDRFRVGGITFQKIIEFRVFNRWGQQIYAEVGNNGWDGTFNGVMQDMGNYYYLIRVVSPDGYLQTFQGEVTLIK